MRNQIGDIKYIILSTSQISLVSCGNNYFHNLNRSVRNCSCESNIFIQTPSVHCPGPVVQGSLTYPFIQGPAPLYGAQPTMLVASGGQTWKPIQPVPLRTHTPPLLTSFGWLGCMYGGRAGSTYPTEMIPFLAFISLLENPLLRRTMPPTFCQEITNKTER